MQSEPSFLPTLSDRAVGMRVAWITPDYPPDRGGVSDHSREMVSVLRETGHEVLVSSRPHERGFALLNAELKAFAPDLIVVAYVPLGYAPHTGGVAPAFMLWSVGVRLHHKCAAILLAHEASLPAAHLWRNREFRLSALGAVQVVQFSILAACFGTVFFSNMGTKQVWAEGLPRLANRFHTFRVCSNIPYHFSDDPKTELTAAGFPVPSTTILFFGTGHPSVLFDYVEAAFLALLELEPHAVLVVVGMSPERLRQLRPTLADLGARALCLGYVSAPQVSLWLQVSTLVLAPLEEGVSARKGTVMAALQHGQAVVTTRGYHTRSDIPWDQICLLAPIEREAFVARAVQAFRDPELRATIGRAARAEYDANASAFVTASRILRYATGELASSKSPNDHT